MYINKFLEKIKTATGHEPRRSGSGWMSRCPAHDDRQASLSVGVGDDGRILLRCHAGCGAKDILTKLGLSLADLMAANGHSGATPARRGGQGGKTVHETIEAAAAAALWSQQQSNSGATLGPIWQYRDASGCPYAAVVRINLPAAENQRGQKVFRPIRKVPGGWQVGDPGKWLPYRVENIGSSGTVHVLEGERCTDSLAAMDFPAVTSAHGAKSAAKTDWSALAGKSVYLWPDNDDAGRKYIADVASILTPLGCTLHMVELLGLPEHGDICDWLSQRPGTETPDTTADILRELVAAAKPIDMPEPASPGGLVASCTCLANVTPRDIQWLWQGVVALGTVTMLCGDPGGGKSTLTLDLASRVSTGGAMPDGSGGVMGSILLMSAEDGMDTTIVPRLIAAGADLNKVHAIDGRVVIADDGTRTIAPINADDSRVIESAIVTHGDVRLLVIDPISAYLGGADSHNNSDIRGLLRPLAELAQRHSVAVVLVSHLTKAPGVKAAYRATGSLAFTALARAAWLITDDPDHPGDRLFVCIKNNLGPSDIGWRFRRLVTGQLEWESAGVKMTAAEALERSESKRADGEPERGPLPEKRQACETWLAGYLAAGPRLAADVEQGALDQGYSGPTLKRAKRNIGATAFRKTVPGAWWVKLPESQEDQPDPLGPHTENLIPLEKPDPLVEKRGFGDGQKTQGDQEDQVFMSGPVEPVATGPESEDMTL